MQKHNLCCYGLRVGWSGLAGKRRRGNGMIVTEQYQGWNCHWNGLADTQPTRVIKYTRAHAHTKLAKSKISDFTISLAKL